MSLPYLHHLTTITLAIVMASSCSAPVNDATPQPEETAEQPLAPAVAVWMVTDDMNAPESAFLHVESDSIFVSLINGDTGARDGNGHIAQLAPDGTVINAFWATDLNAPKGLRSHNDTLWVTDLDEVVGLDLASGEVTSRVKIEGAQFLNDLATGPDGTVYVSDNRASRIYAILDGEVSVFAEGDVVEVPNGLLVDGNHLVVGSMSQSTGEDSEPGHLFGLDLTTKEKTVLSSESIGTIDGVESDGHGGYIVTNVLAGLAVHVDASGATQTIKNFEGLVAADLAYDTARKQIIVPHLFQNQVGAYDVSDVLE